MNIVSMITGATEFITIHTNAQVWIRGIKRQSTIAGTANQMHLINCVSTVWGFS